MDSKTKLKKHLGVSSTALVITIILAVICLASMIGSITAFDSYEAPKPVKFDPTSTPEGVYAYIDVVAVSDWIYKTESDSVADKYYIALDSDNLYTVNMSDMEFEAMSAQYEFGLSDDVDAPIPEPYRLYGMSETMDSELVDVMTRQFELSDADEYRELLGGYYLNTELEPVSDEGGWLLMLAFITGLAALLFMIIYLSKKKMLKKTLSRLEETNELDKVAEQLNADDNITYPRQGITLSRDYIFSKRGKSVLRYSDIFWIYTRIQRINLVKVGQSLIVNTVKHGTKAIAAIFPSSKNEGVLEEIVDEIEKRNPQILVGYIRDNIDAYSRAVATARQESK